MTEPVRFEVGEEVAVRRGVVSPWREILTITRITPSGRYVAADASGKLHEFHANGVSRKAGCRHYIEKLTPEIREVIERAQLIPAIEALVRGSSAWHLRPLDNLRIALKALGGKP